MTAKEQSRTLEVQLAETGRSFVSESARVDQGAKSEVCRARPLRNVIVREPLPKYHLNIDVVAMAPDTVCRSPVTARGTLHGGDNDTTLSRRCKRLDRLLRLLNFRRTT